MTTTVATAATTLVSRSTTATALARKHGHPRDAAIEFHEDTHSYFVTAADGVKHKAGLSVTGLINTVIRDPFNAPEVAAKLAARPSRKYNAGVGPDGRFLPLTAEAILASWDARRDLGTDLHGKIELYLNGTPEAELFGGASDESAVNFAEFRQFKRWFEACGLEAYRTEWVIYATVDDAGFRETYADADADGDGDGDGDGAAATATATAADHRPFIAGSVDFVGRNPVTGNYVIVDWKRCAHGAAESGFASSYGGAKMLPPADALEECKLSHWTIQVNVYRCILEACYGITVERMLMLALYPGQEEAVEYEHARDDSVAATLLRTLRQKEAAAGAAAVADP
jgi:hypothetical protein